ncbi:HAMP domain-containing protein [Sphingomonas panacisoli]|uniref:histidine kinase n=1 Tax=Sphingomonas panacisoli TaxID=1813879 RepID=A0A5B8LIE6_9SPHN|nr:ATP-binding protein [Sphingomonas panacisoli]QDZ07913.1 HAMP domain-containing protein [Sphingomonas panacisoli]
MLSLKELGGAASFRLAAFFAAVFGSASLAFVTIIYLTTSSYLSGNPDERMRYQAQSFDGNSSKQIGSFLDQHNIADPTGRRPFGLFTAEGQPLGGNLKRLPTPMPPLERFFETTVSNEHENTLYRSFLHRLPDGRLIVVSRNIEELQHFRNELLEATLLGLAVMIVLGSAGAIAIGVGSIRRFDGLTRSIERITQGDLSGRLPVRGTNDETDRLVRVINAMLEQIERLMGEVKGVCDSIAHDLRTPLTRLLAGLERANRRNLSAAERKAEIDHAIAEVNLMLRTFAALLRISEIEDGARRASFREVDLTQIAADAVEYYEPAAESKAIRIRFDPLGSDGVATTVNGDIDLLFEAFGNLIDNAIKYTPSGGNIRVELIDGPQLRITDDGRGIDHRDREKLKLRFQRGSQVNGIPGSGLGLPLVGAIARLHGMDLRFDDVANRCRVVMGPATMMTATTRRKPRPAKSHRLN